MTQCRTFDLHQGSGPLLISMPHVGTKLPEDPHSLKRGRAGG